MPASFSLSLGPAKPNPPPRKPAPTFSKRSAAHLDPDSDSDPDTATHAAKVQLVTAFDASRGGAVDTAQAPAAAKGPLVIPKLSNRNWREEAERRRGAGKKQMYLPPEAVARREGAAGVSGEDLVETDTAEQRYGLQVFERAADTGEEEEEGGGGAAAAAAAAAAATDAPPAAAAPPPPPEEPRTDEELALASLLRGDAPAPSTLVLAPSAATAGNDWRTARAAAAAAAAGGEDAAFKVDVASRPEMATLEDYAAVPVEEFGAALLRGMGWREGDEVGKRRGAAGAAKPRVVERRAAFLGIGAKAKEEALEAGAWGKGDRKRRRGRVDTTYVPVVMVDKKTGRIVDPAEVEAEAEAKKGVEAARWEKNGEGANANGRGEAQRRDRSRDRERGGDRDRDRDRRERRGSYDSSDRRRRRDRERSKDRGSSARDRDRERRRGDDDRDRRRGDDRRRDDNRRDRDRRDRR